jgi:hypothetical protein
VAHPDRSKRLNQGFRAFCLLVLLAAALAQAGCAAKGRQENFRLSQLGKSDLDFVVDANIKAQHEYLYDLTAKLYARNPGELRKVAGRSLEGRLEQLFRYSGPLVFEELQKKQGTEAILLGLDPAYAGDRVFAVMAGLTDMIRRSYGYNNEYFMLNQLDQQKLYNSARNIEVLVWRLKHRQDPTGKPLLLTSDTYDGVENLSFERLFGKMIALQDNLARITAQKNNRSITFVVQRAATWVFLPI